MAKAAITNDAKQGPWAFFEQYTPSKHKYVQSYGISNHQSRDAEWWLWKRSVGSGAWSGVKDRAGLTRPNRAMLLLLCALVAAQQRRYAIMTVIEKNR
jgi:hypothetical protein